MPADPNHYRECLNCYHCDTEPAFVAEHVNLFTCPLCGSTDTLGVSDSPLLRGDTLIYPEPPEPAWSVLTTL